MLSTVLVSASKNNKIAVEKNETPVAAEAEITEQKAETSNIAVEEAAVNEATATEEKISAADVKLSTVAAPSRRNMSVLTELHLPERRCWKIFQSRTAQKHLILKTPKKDLFTTPPNQTGVKQSAS